MMTMTKRNKLKNHQIRTLLPARNLKSTYLAATNAYDTHHRRNHTAKIYKVEKTPRETQTLREGCSNAEPKIFTPPQTPFLGAQDGQNLISWRWSLPLPTDPVWWGSMHAISSYRGNRPTNKQTHLQTHRQDQLQYTASQLASTV